MSSESEELKVLTQQQLASIVWPPRLPKDNASYLDAFAEHLRVKFNEHSADRYSKELSEFANMRNVAISILSESSLRDTNSLKSLKKYYCQLVSILSRFRECGASFTWRDSFGRNTTEGNLDFEVNNIIYNIAAIHTELGSKLSKNSESTTKEACIHYNNALWWVQELRDNRSGPKPKEMGHDMLTFFFHVVRAQAQECVMLHSLRAGIQPGNVAKIAAQIASDYEVASKLAYSPLYTDPIKEIMSSASTFQHWKATVEFKHKYFSAITHLLIGLSHSDDNAKEIGIRVARLKLAHQTLEPSKKLISDSLDSQTTKSVYATVDSLVTRKLDKAIRYNDNVYHAIIPGLETLAQPEVKLLVAPIAFSIASIPDFKDLFSSIVTIESVQVSSIYTQKKDELARQLGSQVEKQDEELAQMMSTLNIDKRSLRLPSIEAPDELVEICAEMSINPDVVNDVSSKLKELDDKSKEIQRALDHVQELLRQRPNRQLEEELNRFRRTHEDALRTTKELQRQLSPEMQKKIHLMATTANPIELLPRVSSVSAEDDEIIKKLEKLLDKVDEMKMQRASLLNQLRQSLKDDDVIKHVVAASSEHMLKEVFDKEIQKHNKYLAPLQSNLKAQNEILDTLERANAQYGQVKLNHRAQRAAFNEHVDSLKKLYSQFKVTSAGVEEGLNYHKKMVDLVKKFQAKVQTTFDLNDLLN